MTKTSKQSHPKHVQTFLGNLSEVNELMKIHTRMAGSTRGRKTNLTTLNKSAIVLLTACWESFIEDLLTDAFNFLIKEASGYKLIPQLILKNVAKELKCDKHELKIWELSDSGWKTVLIQYKDKILLDKLDYFHVPRPDKIDELFKQLLSLDKATEFWKWRKMSNTKAKKILNDFIDIRGAIAHKVKTSKRVQKKDVIFYATFLNRIGIILHNHTNQHLYSITGISPWTFYRFSPKST